MPISAANRVFDRFKSPPSLPGRRNRVFLSALLLLLGLPFLYWGLLPAFLQTINDDPDFGRAAIAGPMKSPQEDAVGTDAGAMESQKALVSGAVPGSVQIAIQLIQREVDLYGWTANDPFFQPTYGLDNMPNFQMGVISGLYRFSLELADQLGRTRGSSQVDEHLDKAAGLLKYAGDIWVFDISTSFLPTASSEKQYRAAMRALEAYADRLKKGEAVFERRSDNLLATLDRMAADMGSASAQIANFNRDVGFFPFSLRADDLFYFNKGRLYAYYLILRELEYDFANVIQERDLTTAWQQMLESLRQAATLDPLIVTVGSASGMATPNHLTAQGFYLLRGRTQMKEITNILLK